MSDDNCVRVWMLWHLGAVAEMKHKGTVRGVCKIDSDKIATGSGDSLIILWK